MSETTTWKHCCECRRRFAFYAEIDKSRCYECELKRKAYREGYEAFRREMVEALGTRRLALWSSAPQGTAERWASRSAVDGAMQALTTDILAGAFPPKPKEGT